jgi:hypothetical protein
MVVQYIHCNRPQWHGGEKKMERNTTRRVDLKFEWGLNKTRERLYLKCNYVLSFS